MAYVWLNDDGDRGAAGIGSALGCGDGCSCGPCRRGAGGSSVSIRLGERYVRDEPRALGWFGEPYRAPFTKGGEAIQESDAAKLLTILRGPSPYRRYIEPVLAARGSALPPRFLRIVTSVRQVPERLRGRFTRGDGTMVGGTVDRHTGTIYMREAPGLRGATRVEFALHEAVHLVAHPFIANVDMGTFQGACGRGFGEGVTQVVTEEIMRAQGISRYYRERPYDEFTPPVRRLIEIFTLDAVARAYFGGNVRGFIGLMQFRWGNGWRRVAGMTSAGQTRAALEEIARCEANYERQRRARPKGDFPVPSSPHRFA